MVTDETYFEASIIAETIPVQQKSKKLKGCKINERTEDDYPWEESDASLLGELLPPSH